MGQLSSVFIVSFLRSESTSIANFPDGFTSGTTSSAYQFEGAVDEGNKGDSIWHTFSRLPDQLNNFVKRCSDLLKDLKIGDARHDILLLDSMRSSPLEELVGRCGGLLLDLDIVDPIYDITPNDIHELLDQHIKKGKIIERIWSGRVLEEKDRGRGSCERD